MKLFMCAHKPEAGSFITNMNFEPDFEKAAGLFRNDQDFLLISGEGMYNTADKLDNILNLFAESINLTVNFGIAGSLSTKLKLSTIYPVQTVFHEDAAVHPSFNSIDPDAQITCISVRKPVHIRDYADKLSQKAQIVDMELWAIASLCSQYGVPFLSFKLISDYAFEKTDIPLIKNKMPIFSRKLYTYFTENLVFRF